jgi:hypothetical protein
MLRFAVLLVAVALTIQSVRAFALPALYDDSLSHYLLHATDTAHHHHDDGSTHIDVSEASVEHLSENVLGATAWLLSAGFQIQAIGVGQSTRAADVYPRPDPYPCKIKRPPRA